MTYTFKIQRNFRICWYKNERSWVWSEREFYLSVLGGCGGNKFHRDDGPAIMWANGSFGWYQNGEWIKNDQI